MTTTLPVSEGIYRAARRTGRGRRKLRVEFIPLDSTTSGTRSNDTSISSGSAIYISSGMGAAAPPSVAELRVSEERRACGTLVLRMRGTVELATILAFRDASFTAIGRRPASLLLDMEQVDDVDIEGISSIVTVGRVARLLKMRFFIAPSPSLRATMEATGICRYALMPNGESVA